MLGNNDTVMIDVWRIDNNKDKEPDGRAEKVIRGRQ